MNGDIFVITGISEGEESRLARIAKGLRQVDVASLVNVNVCDAAALEKDRHIKKTRKRNIGHLGLSGR